LADTEHYYSEFKEIVELLEGKASISIFKFKNIYEGDSDVESEPEIEEATTEIKYEKFKIY